MKNLEKYRSEFPITQKINAYLNHAAISPVPKRAIDSINEFYQELSISGSLGYNYWIEEIDKTRDLIARLIDCRSDEIAFFENTSSALSAIASGIRWKEGDAIMIPEGEFPSNIYPWVNLESRGVRIIRVPVRNGDIHIDDLNRLITPDVKMLSLSWVDFLSGSRRDLNTISDFCKKKGILLCVDAIQALGAVPISVKELNIHFLASGAHKWLLGPMGCGFLYISKEVNHIINPVIVGWKSVTDEMDFFKERFELKTNALRFEPGTMNVAGILGLKGSLELLLEAGIPDIYRKIQSLLNMVIEGLTSRGFRILTPDSINKRAGILSFYPRTEPENLFRHFLKKGVILSLRKGLIRLSPHFYNNRDDIERFFSALDSGNP